LGLAWIATAIGSGLAGAFFLTALGTVTAWHRQHPRLIFLLPALGLVGAVLYQRWGANSARGTRLLIEESRHPAAQTPFRLAPLILVSTLLTHLGGGSAGREGTALQLGGGIAAGARRLLGLGPETATRLIPAGMAAGFGAVFGTPWAAGIFAVECVRPTASRARSLIECLAAAWLAHGVATAVGARHAHLHFALTGPAHPLYWMFTALLCGAAMGFLSRGFILTGHHVATTFSRIPSTLLRPVVGGSLLITLSFLTGSRAYLGLGAQPMDPGDPSIESCFSDAACPPWAWAAKWIFTVVTLGSGFRGGEVTPLFFIGATAGHTLGSWLGAPPQLTAAAGLAALFAGASRAPAACFVMGIELFGWTSAPYLLIACLAAFACGHRQGLYGADRTPPSTPPPAPGEFTARPAASTSTGSSTT
jgi:H+/Cl- antiporter ClcA